VASCGESLLDLEFGAGGSLGYVRLGTLVNRDRSRVSFNLRRDIPVRCSGDV
jgi:hypothetical protein